jgi:hypothetical protein
VRVESTSSGVLDHAIFVDNFKHGINNLGYGVTVYGENQWVPNPQTGGPQAIFVEDSLFVNYHALLSDPLALPLIRLIASLPGPSHMTTRLRSDE